jgi:hypothetical protein
MYFKHPYLTGGSLADKPGSLPLGNAIRVETETLDVSVRRRAVVATVAAHFADLDHCALLNC